MTTQSIQSSKVTMVLEKAKSLIALSAPIIVSRVGFLTLSVVDLAMVGHYATNALAGLSIAHAIVDTFMLICVGMLFGVLVVSSIAVGESKPQDAGLALKRGSLYAVGIGLFAVLGCWVVSSFLSFFGFEDQLASDISRLMLILMPGLIPVLVHIVYSFFLEGISKPLAATLVVLAANMINILLNYALVFGEFGFPEMGAEGSALSTTIVRFLLAGGLIVFVHFIFVDRDRFEVNKKFKWDWASWGMMRQIGYGGGVSFGLESGAYMGLALLAGLVSPIAAATMAVLINIRSVLFMVPMGIGFATSVHVGMGFGAKDSVGVNNSTWVGVSLGVVCSLFLCVLLLISPNWFFGIYSADPVLIQSALSVLLFLVISFPLDAWQSIMSNALRGREDAIVPMMFHGLAFVIVMLPLAWFLALDKSMGISGLFQAMVVGNLIAAVLMTARHFHLNETRPFLKDAE